MAKHRMTPDQARASQPELTAWVSASAGTGKTHVLTARVLRLLLNNVKPSRILCLTFTKAAAAEMKNRLFAKLGSWVTMDDESLADDILHVTDEVADSDLLDRARRAFAQVLDVPGGLQILTFHSFCQSLLGRFPLEAGLVPGFEGLDETLAAEVMRESRDHVLMTSRYQSGERLQKAMQQVATRVNEEDFGKAVNAVLFEAPQLREALDYYTKVGLSPALYRAMGLTPGATRQDIIAAALIDEAFPVEELKTLAELMAAGKATESKCGTAILPLLQANSAFRKDHIDAYMDGLLTKGQPRKKLPSAAVKKSHPDLADIFLNEQQRIADLYAQLLKLDMVEATLALLTLGMAQMDSYANLKAHRGLVDFDDMIASTVSLLSQRDIAPWVQFKLDDGLHHVLVDEAQDTNRDQWRVIETLISEFFAGEGASDQLRTVFAVGDVKQSIFSFQKADPRQFVAARDRIFDRALSAGYAADIVPLNQSFRSGGAVLSLVDSVFHADGGAVIADEKVEHDYTRKGAGGVVELWPLECPSEKEEAGPGWVAATEQESKQDAEQKAAWRIASDIRARIDAGELLESKGRPITEGDILVIVRRRTPFVDYLTKALKQLDLAVTGRDRMTLSGELVIQDLIAIMKFALQPDDDLTCAEVLKGPLIGLDDAQLFDLAFDRKASLWKQVAAGRKVAHIASAYEILVDVLAQADRGTPFDFLTYILNALKGRQKFMERMGAEINDPVDELLAQAIAFESQHAVSLQAFVQSLSVTDTIIKRDMEQGENAIRIMTAHGSKGLQAPIVYLSDLVGKPDSTRDAKILRLPAAKEGAPDLLLWRTSGSNTLPAVKDMIEARKKDLMDEYNRLLYVALTRAEDRLYIAGWQGNKEPDPDSWFARIQSGFERLDGVVVEQTAGGDKYTYTVGQEKPVKKEPQKTEDKKAQPVLPDYVYQLPFTDPVPSVPLVPSRPDDMDAVVVSPLDRARKSPFARGQLLHSLLEWLPEVAKPQRRQVAVDYLSKPGLGLKAKDAQAFADEVMAVLEDDTFAAVFSANSRAEVPVSGVVEGRVVSGQIDRLVVSDSHVLIVDYKTNRPAAQTVDRIQSLYIRQMALYRQLLQSVYPGRKVAAAILWTDQANLMEIPDQMMDEALKSL